MNRSVIKTVAACLRHVLPFARDAESGASRQDLAQTLGAKAERSGTARYRVGTPAPLSHCVACGFGGANRLPPGAKASGGNRRVRAVRDDGHLLPRPLLLLSFACALSRLSSAFCSRVPLFCVRSPTLPAPLSCSPISLCGRCPAFLTLLDASRVSLFVLCFSFLKPPV